ncbi:MAG: hypothetical protein ACREIV_02385 [Planctomycetaceae bacterium]
MSRADPDQPNLGVGNASAQLVARLQFIRIKLVRTALDVDAGEPAFVFGRQVRTDLRFVNLIATAGEVLP